SCVLCLCAAILPSCESAPQSSTLSVDDLQATTSEMAAKLAASDFLRSRTPDSERIVIAINKVENLTSDIIPESDQWWMMARVRDAQGIRTLSEQKNIRVVIPAEFLRKAKKSKELP